MTGTALLLDRLLAAELMTWAEGPAGTAVIDPDGVLASAGHPGPFAWASVTKLLTSLTVLQAVDRGLVSLDDEAGPPGATLRHLLAHASGLAFDDDRVVAAPGARRIYSNRGIEVAAGHLERRAGIPFGDLLHQLVLAPLSMQHTALEGSPAHGAHGPVADLGRLARELLAPRHLSSALLAEATRPAYPGLVGLLPGFGRQQPNDWGLGFEIRTTKTPHWTSPDNAPTTFGHFGQSGAFLWVDRLAGVACVYAGAQPFGPWATEAWPRLSTQVLTVLGVRTVAEEGASA